MFNRWLELVHVQVWYMYGAEPMHVRVTKWCIYESKLYVYVLKMYSYIFIVYIYIYIYPYIYIPHI
jgi:hypothetical protein